MAVLARYNELRKEIDALITENEELKQLVLLLRENQDLRVALNDSALVPTFESTRISEPANQAFLETSSWDCDRSSFVPGLRLGIRQRRPADRALQQVQHYPPPPPPGGGAGALPRAHFPIRMAMQQPTARQAPARPPPSLPMRALPGPNQANEGFFVSHPIPANVASSTVQGAQGPQGFCYECQDPWHPHFSSLSFPSTQNLSDLSSVFGPSLPASQTLTDLSTGLASTFPSTQHLPDLTSVFGTYPVGQNLSELTSVFSSAIRPLRWEDMPALDSVFVSANCPYLPVLAIPPGAAAAAAAAFFPPVQLQPTFQPLALRNPSPFVLQPPPPGRRARPAPLAAQQPYPPVLLAAGPLQAPTDPQRPPDVRPKERRAPVKQDAAGKTSSDAKAKDLVKRERIIGEIAFQLDRRILSNVFPDRIRLYGFTVRNIPEKLAQRGKDPFMQLTPEMSDAILMRYTSIMDRLQPLGYKPNTHPHLGEHIVNTFGILQERPDPTGPEAASYNDIKYLRDLVKTTAPSEMFTDCLLLLNCLYHLSQDDGKPLFIW